MTLLSSSSQVRVDQQEPRYGFYSEYQIKTAVSGKYPSLLTYGQSFYKKVQNQFSKLGEAKKEDYLLWLNRYLPSTVWVPQYFRNWKGWVPKDLVAGLSVCFVEIPQGLSYAGVAGYPSINGLYASSFPLMVFTAFSSCKVLSVGPVASDSVLMASAITTYTHAKTKSAEYVEVGCVVSFVAGLTLLIMGLCRMGWIMTLLSRPVMNGYIVAAACIAISTQVSTVLGVSTLTTQLPFLALQRAFDVINATNVPTVVVSIITAFLLLLPRFIPRFPQWIPMPLVVTILGIILSSSIKFDKRFGIKLVDDIPQGLPTLKVPKLSLFFTVFPQSFLVGIIGYMGAIAMSYAADQKITDRNRRQLQEYRKKTENNGNAATVPLPLEPVRTSIDASQEMIAYGLSDLLCSFMASQVISASFSRTALLIALEGHTLIPNIMDSIFCIIVITSATHLLYYLPKCILSCIVIVAASRLLEDGFKESRFLYNVSRLELLEFLIAFIIPLFYSLEIGVVVAIGVSLCVRLYKTSESPIIQLGQIYGGNIESPQIYYANTKHWKEAKTIPNIEIIELRSELSFINHKSLTNYISNIIERNQTILEESKEKSNPNFIKYIILCLVHTQQTDSTSLRQLMSIFDDIDDVTICLAHIRKPVRDLLFRFNNNNANNDETVLSSNVSNIKNDKGYDQMVGNKHNLKTFISTHDAVLYCQQQTVNEKKQNKDDGKNDVEIVYNSNASKATSDNVTLASNDTNNDNDNIGKDTISNNSDGNDTNNTNDDNHDENQNHLNEDLRLQSHVRNRFTNIPNAETSPLQPSINLETTN